MISEKNETVQIENKSLRIVLNCSENCSGNGRIKELTNLLCGETMNSDRELFRIQIRGKELSSDQFVLKAVKKSCDEIWEMVTLLMEEAEECLRARVHFISDKEDSVTVLWQIYDGYKLGEPDVSRMKIPLLAEFDLGSKESVKYFPACCMRGRKGMDVIKRPPESFYTSDIRMPLVICDRQNKNGFSVEFLSQSDLSDEGAVQNVSGLLAAYIDSEEHLRDHNILINPDASFNDTVELCITGIKGGWPEAFDRCRCKWMSRYDFSEYDRKDLDWLKTCVIHNFSFLYGKEAFDHEKQRVDTNRLLKAGQEFGGYDTVTIWNQYPRLGVDQRSQWDFYDDFPGGRSALKEMVEEFHEKDVKVLLPYIPWDRGKEESTESMGDEFARIIADTGADGYQLDTCKELPASFRKKLDDVRPGLLLQTQAHPYKNRPMEFITSSWDEFWYGDPMPEIDLLRFMMPKHLAPVISRWLRREDKTVLIKRCIFNAAPIVIWQDIFGKMLPYSKEQKCAIREWKEVYLKHRDIYQGENPIPLYPVDEKGVYCNRFADKECAAYIYSLYNDNEKEKVIRLDCGSLKRASVLLGAGTISSEGKELHIRIEAKTVVHVMTEQL